MWAGVGAGRELATSSCVLLYSSQYLNRNCKALKSAISEHAARQQSKLAFFTMLTAAIHFLTAEA